MTCPCTASAGKPLTPVQAQAVAMRTMRMQDAIREGLMSLEATTPHGRRWGSRAVLDRLAVRIPRSGRDS